MAHAYKIMKNAVSRALKEELVSIGGLIGGESKRLFHHAKEQSVCGEMMSKAISYAVGVLEVNSSMGLIVAAATAITNILGLVCDPIAGLVEAPCQKRNAMGGSNALISAEMALCGIKHIVPFDETVEAMYHVGKSMPAELRETALGGIANTPTACELCKGIFK